MISGLRFSRAKTWDAVLSMNHRDPRKGYIFRPSGEKLEVRVIQSQKVGFRKEAFLVIAYYGKTEMYHRT